MKLFGLTLIITVCSAGIFNESSEGYIYGKTRYFLFPADNNDRLFLVDAQEPVDKEFLRNNANNLNNLKFWLFTRANPTVPQILRLYEDDSVHLSNFNSRKTSIFLAHGWRSDANTNMNKVLTGAFLQDDDVNVIVFDWSKIAEKSYVTAKAGIVQAGKGLGQFINWLTRFALDYDKTHIVGFSLGGHLVGYAGRETGGSVKRITALDPAGPLFDDNDRIYKTDGQYVEVIHTNSKWLGYTAPCGHVDHYPNGGSGMPNCWFMTCSHGMAWKYMAATVKYNHLKANQCETLFAAQNGKCNGGLALMGNSDLSKSRRGIFRVNTDKDFPY